MEIQARVTVVEALPSILAGTDPELSQVVARKLKKMGGEVLTGAKAKSWTDKGDRAVVTVEAAGGEVTLDAHRSWSPSAAGLTPRTCGSRRWG